MFLLKGPKRFFKEISWTKKPIESDLATDSGLQHLVRGSEQYSSEHFIEFTHAKYPKADKKFLKLVVETYEEIESEGKQFPEDVIKKLEEGGAIFTTEEKQQIKELYDFRTEYFMLTGLAEQ